ncbi:hypothetical protein REH65_32325 [Saccharopolyspora sp. ID03-671]|uniref:hypothetical protein n=1 Tax=Saccharopolyspora sp. ID03-671 TaxID=3073066 RepID=UPI00324F1991
MASDVYVAPARSGDTMPSSIRRRQLSGLVSTACLLAIRQWSSWFPVNLVGAAGGDESASFLFAAELKQFTDLSGAAPALLVDRPGCAGLPGVLPGHLLFRFSAGLVDLVAQGRNSIFQGRVFGRDDISGFDVVDEVFLDQLLTPLLLGELLGIAFTRALQGLADPGRAAWPSAPVRCRSSHALLPSHRWLGRLRR